MTMRNKRNPPTGKVEGLKSEATRATSKQEKAQDPTPRKAKPRERWRAVPGMKGVRVSSCGRVRGAEVKTREGRRTVRGKSVARVVWTTFRGPVEPGLEIHHVNHDRKDDRLDNLQCLTRREHAKADGRKVELLFQPWDVAEAFVRDLRGHTRERIEEATGISGRHLRHLFDEGNRRARLVHFLAKGVHPGGQLDAFGPMLDDRGRDQ
jgi:hypothetical protein